MTQPGALIPPPPGWWVRTAHVGVNTSDYGWAGTVTGNRPPSGDYGWGGSVTGATPGVSIIGSAAANATSVAIPTHQAGDLLIIYAVQNSGGSVSAPTPGGTVPAWANIDANTGANGIASLTASFVAVANNTTTGTWGANTLIVVVLRGKAGTLAIGGHAESGSLCSLPTGPTAPSITMSQTNGTSKLLHFFGLVNASWTVFGSAPTGYTTQTSVGNTSGGACFDTKDVTTSDGAVTQSTDGSGSGVGYRGATIEVKIT